MVFKPKGSEKRRPKARGRLNNELTRIAPKSINKGKYYEEMGHSFRTQRYSRQV